MTAVETQAGRLVPPLGPAIGVALRQKQLRRSQFAVVLLLAPVNDAFEKKSLVVPFAPEVMKLGRQTNAKTAASPDNGYFDSRVLSRQHAELWADRDTGKVWLKDCKSSNGTYINKQRLSSENTESEPFELKKHDLIELGIDIACDDNSSLVYKKISARVERVSMIPLHVKPIVTSASDPANGTHAASPSPISTPNLSRSPSLATLKGLGEDKKNEQENYAMAIFGAPSASLETMALTHSRNTVGGLSVKADTIQNVEFELATKRLVQEVRAAKMDLAKINSVKSMLEDMRRQQTQAPAVPVAALRVENDRLHGEIHALTSQVAELKLQLSASQSGQHRASPVQTAASSHKERTIKPTDINNFVLLVSTCVLMVLTGVSIMLLFNPPTWQT